MKLRQSSFIVSLLLLFLAINFESYGFSTYQHKPCSLCFTPYFSQDKFQQYSLSYSSGSATEAFNKVGKKVPFMQQFGTEEMLKRFTDETVDRNDTTSFGLGQLSGELKIKELNLSFYRNIKNGFFIEAQTTLHDYTIDSINASFIDSEKNLSTDQISYMKDLNSKLPTKDHQTGFHDLTLFGGYSRTFHNFKHFDFIDITIKTGIITPEFNNKTKPRFLQIPFEHNRNFGYATSTALSAGLFDWLTIGCNGLATLWNPTTATIAINHTETNNNLLLTEESRAKINKGNLYAGSMFIEADHLFWGLSGMIAYSYTKNRAITITPIDSSNFPLIAARNNKTLEGWSQSSLLTQIQMDFATEDQPNAPVLTMFYALPIKGRYSVKTSVVGGSCGLQLSYKF